ILKVISMEEERFDATIDAGLSILSNMIRDAIKNGKKELSGEDAFKLYDTFGFPLDLTKEILAENHLNIDEETFKKLMKDQRERARAARGNVSGWDNATKSLLGDLPQTAFRGYDSHRTDDAEVLAIIVEDEEGTRAVNEVNEGDCTVILNKTVFYGEGGGQVGDRGTLSSPTLLMNVRDTKKTDGIYLHLCTVVSGSLKVGDKVCARIDSGYREAIARNHSVAHLLQAALRTVLGSHVEQAGSLVDEKKCRFDFTHFAALTAEEIAKVEALVNAHIFAGLPITMTEMPLDDAKKLGAMALFGEKYGKTVRVVRMGNFSTELCGGTHMDNTARIGLFKIVSETSVAAGVRRIEACTGFGVLRLLESKEQLLSCTADTLKAQNVADVAKRAAQLQDELKSMHRELDALNAKLAGSKKDEVLKAAVAVGSVKLAAVRFDAMQLDVARSLADDIKASCPDTVAVIAAVNGADVKFLAVAGKDAVAQGAHAGKLVGAVAAITGGKGGGRPDNAMAGGKDADKVDEALASAASLLEDQLK
ncbi:MAG: alanine--tRNA ligase, partial [Clostridia bacterium]|nr:alanine--tRNA ligase [Clostridia bacterium]